MNKDNYALSEKEMTILDASMKYVINDMVKRGESEIIINSTKYCSDMISLKINKLNKLANNLTTK